MTKPISVSRSLRLAGVLVPALLATFIYGCGSDPVRHGVTPVAPPPPPPVGASFSVDRSGGDIPFVVSFNNLSTNASAFHWDFGDGSTSSERNPSHQFSTFGRHTVTLSAVGQDGSTSAKSLQIVANEIVAPFGSRTVDYGPFWPTHTQGDCDFDGHGPDVWMDAVLWMTSDRTRLVVNTHMKARETTSDWSTAEGNWQLVVWTAPSNAIIEATPAVTELHVYYRGTDHAYHTTVANDLGFFYWLGDTDGNDICNTTLDDTNMHFFLKPFQVRLMPR